MSSHFSAKIILLIKNTTFYSVMDQHPKQSNSLTVVIQTITCNYKWTTPLYIKVVYFSIFIKLFIYLLFMYRGVVQILKSLSFYCCVWQGVVLQAYSKWNRENVDFLHLRRCWTTVNFSHRPTVLEIIICYTKIQNNVT